ncbi:MAG: hypothetical protein U0745_03940 [Polyangia bacterium]
MRNRMMMAGALALLGCGPSTGPVTMVGASIFTSDVQVLVAEDYGGGFAPAPPPGSTCVMGAAKYSLTVATKTVDWTRCLVKGTDPYKPVSGSKVLTDAEYKNLSLYLENLTVAAPGSACGADKSILEVTITTPSGKQVYGDSFYSCTIKDKPLLKTETISSLFQQLYNLTM